MAATIATKELTIPLGDGYHANARLTGHPQQRLLIFIHGLASTMDDLIAYETTRFFSSHNFATLRFNLYDWTEGTRDLFDCTLTTFAKDTLKVIEYARTQGFRCDIALIGHSYGGLTALMTPQLGQNMVQRVVLLDPTHPTTSLFDDTVAVKLTPTTPAYWMRSGIGYIFSQAQVNEFNRLNTTTLLQDYNTKTWICSAGKGALTETNMDYFRQLKAKNLIAGYTTSNLADHSFSDEPSRTAMFRGMLSWLQS